jgi:hypothetical protein
MTVDPVGRIRLRRCPDCGKKIPMLPDGSIAGHEPCETAPETIEEIRERNAKTLWSDNATQTRHIRALLKALDSATAEKDATVKQVDAQHAEIERLRRILRSTVRVDIDGDLVVIKMDFDPAGKGVIVCRTIEDIREAIVVTRTIYP